MILAYSIHAVVTNKVILTYNTCMVLRNPFRVKMQHSNQTDTNTAMSYIRYLYTVQEQLPSPTKFRFYSVHITKCHS